MTFDKGTYPLANGSSTFLGKRIHEFDSSRHREYEIGWAYARQISAPWGQLLFLLDLDWIRLPILMICFFLFSLSLSLSLSPLPLCVSFSVPLVGSLKANKWCDDSYFQLWRPWEQHRAHYHHHRSYGVGSASAVSYQYQVSRLKPCLHSQNNQSQDLLLSITMVTMITFNNSLVFKEKKEKIFVFFFVFFCIPFAFV